MEMSALQRDRDRLLDHATGRLSADDVLLSTRSERDALSNRCSVLASWMHCICVVTSVKSCGLILFFSYVNVAEFTVDSFLEAVK